MGRNVSPRYSHSGDGASGAITGSGSPIYLGDNCIAADMNIFVVGGNATVFLEFNGGLADPASGTPPSGEWVDVTGGSGYSLTPTTPVGKTLPTGEPYWRTRITALDPGAVVTSYVPGIRTFTGDWINAVRPPSASPPNLS